MPSGVLVSLVFGEVFFAGSASLHDWLLHFLLSAFSVTLEYVMTLVFKIYSLALEQYILKQP